MAMTNLTRCEDAHGPMLSWDVTDPKMLADRAQVVVTLKAGRCYHCPDVELGDAPREEDPAYIHTEMRYCPCCGSMWEVTPAQPGGAESIGMMPGIRTERSNDGQTWSTAYKT
jgi:hypothetical protein